MTRSEGDVAAAGTQAGTQAADSVGLAAPLLAVFVSLFAFVLLSRGTEYVANEAPERVLGWAAVILVPAALFAGTRWDGLAAAPRTFLVGGCLFLLLYFAVEPFAIPYAALGPDHVASRFHEAGRFVGFVLALAALAGRRPSLLWAAAMWLWMIREMQETLTGFYFSTLDIRNIAEVIAFVALGTTLVRAALASAAVATALGLDGRSERLALLLLLAIGIGAHFGNYLYSGLAKMALDGGPLSWVLHNRLADGIPGALEKGTLPYAASPILVEQAHRLLLTLAIPVNLAALAMQLVAPAALASRRWAIRATIGFDLFHILVYLALGLLFWKWIALNLIIVATLLRLPDREWAGLPARAALLASFVGLLVFKTATLAWYDTPGFASPFFEAEMADGKRVRLPSAFFRSSSYQVSQGRIWWPGGDGHFNPSIWGSVLHWEDNLAGRHCRVPVRAAPADPKWGPPLVIAQWVAEHHRQLTGRLDARGQASYYALPHHHVPSPFVADPVKALDLRRIRSYIYVVESVCLSLRDGRLVRRVVERTEVPMLDVASGTLLPAGTR